MTTADTTAMSSRCIALSQQASPTFEAESDPWVVNGIALGEGDTTRGASGVATYWPARVLREAASKLEGVPIVANNNPESHDPTAQPPVSDIVGEVTDAAYAKGVGIIYQGEVDDPDIARQIARGRVDVSPVMARSLGDYDDQREARVAESISEFRDLGIVFQGASASNSIEIGPNPSAAALAGEALAAAWQSADPAAEVEALQQFKHLEYPGGTMGGSLDEAAISSDSYRSHYLLPGETKTDSAYPVVDAEGNLRKENVKAAWNLRGQADVPKADMERILLRLNSKFDTPPIDPDNAEALGVATEGDAGDSTSDEAAESATDTPDTDTSTDDSAGAGAPAGGDDAPTTHSDGDTVGDGPSIPAGDSDTDSPMDLSEDEEALVHAARSLDNPSVVDADAEAFADKREQYDDPEIVEADVAALGRDAAAFDDPQIVAAEEYDALTQTAEHVEALREFLGDALAEQTGLSEAAAKALPFESLMQEFTDDDGDVDAEALLQTPETRTPDTATTTDTATAGGDIEALSRDERRDVRQKLDKADMMAKRTPEYAESLRAEAAAIVGVESADDIDMEAL